MQAFEWLPAILRLICEPMSASWINRSYMRWEMRRIFMKKKLLARNEFPVELINKMPRGIEQRLSINSSDELDRRNLESRFINVL